MKRTKRLPISRETIRQLASAELTSAAGGGSQVQTCSVCVGFTGCHTGDNCLQVIESRCCDTNYMNSCWPPPLK